MIQVKLWNLNLNPYKILYQKIFLQIQSTQFLKNIFQKEKKHINIKKFESKLYTNGIPDPEILIRTGGAKRLSNFLLWQLAYTEIFFIDKLWPDFNEGDYNKILNNFYNIKRNFGKI